MFLLHNREHRLVIIHTFSFPVVFITQQHSIFASQIGSSEPSLFLYLVLHRYDLLVLVINGDVHVVIRIVPTFLDAAQVKIVVVLAHHGEAGTVLNFRFRSVRYKRLRTTAKHYKQEQKS